MSNTLESGINIPLRLLIFGIFSTLLLSSCVSKKQFTELEARLKEKKELLDTATVKLNSCLTDYAAANARVEAMRDQLNDLRRANQDLIDTKGNLTTLTQKGAENLEKSLESLQERDLKITRLQDALNRKDSVTLAVVSSLKAAVGIDNPNIQVNVEKGVVYVSISDKLLFNSGSFTVTTRARNVLEKIAKVISDKPDLEFMVEGHTDNLLIDQEKASDLGVSTLEIGRSVETIFGSRNVTKFTKDGREYDIILQGDIKNRKECTPFKDVRMCLFCFPNILY